MISTDMTSKVPDLKKNLDPESIHTIDVMVQRQLNYPDESYRFRTSKREGVVGGLLPVEMNDVRKTIEKSLALIGKRIKFPSKNIEESVFYFHHGLSLLPLSVKQYIKDHDFIDAGAFTGDSAIALRDYQYKKIFSIELSSKSIEKYMINLTRNKITPDRYEIIQAGISSNGNNRKVLFADTGSAGLSLLREAGKYDEISVESRSLDSIVEEYKISPRFIKSDIEGNSLELVKGACKTLVKYRPVLSLAIYHNPLEFFEVKPFLEGLLKDYIFMVRKLSTGIKFNQCHSEVILLGCPKEILI
jgi:FkbM family methyltransferase